MTADYTTQVQLFMQCNLKHLNLRYLDHTTQIKHHPQYSPVLSEAVENMLPNPRLIKYLEEEFLT